MPLHKYPPAIWKNLNLKEGIYSRLPSHYLQSLQETRKPTPVHWVPHGAKYKLNPKTGQRERVQDVPILPYFPPEADKGLWGGEGWISGFRYANNDKAVCNLLKHDVGQLLSSVGRFNQLPVYSIVRRMLRQRHFENAFMYCFWLPYCEACQNSWHSPSCIPEGFRFNKKMAFKRSITDHFAIDFQMQFQQNFSTRWLKVKKTWKPQLFARELYSEILDKTFTITVTMRTMDLIDAVYGFDFYILKTSKVDLKSKLGMDLKRAMLLRLARRDSNLHPDDPAKRDLIYDKYKEFGPSLSGAEALGNLKSPLMESGPPDHHPNLVYAGMADTKEHVITYQEAEWVGLTLEEAVEKQRLLEKKDPEPLFKVYAEELAQQLQSHQLAEPVIVEQKH